MHSLAILGVLCESVVVRLGGKITYLLSHSQNLRTLESTFIRGNMGDINLTPAVKEDAVNEDPPLIHLSI